MFNRTKPGKGVARTPEDHELSAHNNPVRSTRMVQEQINYKTQSLELALGSSRGVLTETFIRMIHRPIKDRFPSPQYGSRYSRQSAAVDFIPRKSA